VDHQEFLLSPEFIRDLHRLHLTLNGLKHLGEYNHYGSLNSTGTSTFSCHKRLTN